jgi:hypothetical protein
MRIVSLMLRPEARTGLFSIIRSTFKWLQQTLGQGPNCESKTIMLHHFASASTDLSGEGSMKTEEGFSVSTFARCSVEMTSDVG